MNTSVATSSEWMQFYEQTVDELSALSSVGFSDATIVATSVSSDSNLNPSTSSLHSGSDQLTPPKGSSPKPIRRRPRISKKTPTTLLNANSSNFRALVQQFTGCPKTPFSLGNRRGPINLNFAVGTERNQTGTATSVMSASGKDYYYQQSHQQENASHQQHQDFYQELQQHAVSFDSVLPDALFSSSSSGANADQILDGFDLDNISLQALNRDVPYSNENANDGNYFLIPIIFEGDLAHIAACHLKENDHVYIDGQLSADPPSSTTTHGQANIQVMVCTINFVDEPPPMMKSIASPKQEETLGHSASTEKGTETAFTTWRDLLDNPKEWQDCREMKLNGLVKPKYPDFKREDGDLALWLDSAPKWVLSELEGLQFAVPTQKSKQVNQHKGDGIWKDLVENPNKWWDNRLDKLNGKVNEKYPDFKHKETGKALWLTYSPAWVESKLSSLESKK